MHTALIHSSFELLCHRVRPGKRRWLTTKVNRPAGLAGSPPQRTERVQPRDFRSFERATRNSSSDKGERCILSRRRTRLRWMATQTQATAKRPSPGSKGKASRRSSLLLTIIATIRTPRKPAKANTKRVALRPQSRRWLQKLLQKGLMQRREDRFPVQCHCVS